MSERAQRKLVNHFELSAGIAEKLVGALLFTPALIRVASDEELLAIPGIGATEVAEIRAKIGPSQ